MPSHRFILAALPLLVLAACNSSGATPDPDPVAHPTASTAFSPEPTFSFQDTPHDQAPSYAPGPGHPPHHLIRLHPNANPVDGRHPARRIGPRHTGQPRWQASLRWPRYPGLSPAAAGMRNSAA